LERAIDVGIWCVTKEKIGTIVLEPVVVNFVGVPVRREVTTIGRTEMNTHCGWFTGAGINNLSVHPCAFGSQDSCADLAVIALRLSAVEQFTNIDFSGSWSGGFGIGRLHNERLLTFELDQTGHVVSGSLINTISGDEIHHYSAGSGNFEIEDTANGRINNFVLVADDGAIAECGFLLVDIDLELIAGVGTDSEVGAAVIEVRR
jgi:hypothetical protein